MERRSCLSVFAEGKLPGTAGLERWDQAGYRFTESNLTDLSAESTGRFASCAQEIYTIHELLEAFKMERMSKACIFACSRLG